MEDEIRKAANFWWKIHQTPLLSWCFRGCHRVKTVMEVLNPLMSWHDGKLKIGGFVYVFFSVWQKNKNSFPSRSRILPTKIGLGDKLLVNKQIQSSISCLVKQFPLTQQVLAFWKENSFCACDQPSAGWSVWRSAGLSVCEEWLRLKSPAAADQRCVCLVLDRLGVKVRVMCLCMRLLLGHIQNNLL